MESLYYIEQEKDIVIRSRARSEPSQSIRDYVVKLDAMDQID